MLKCLIIDDDEEFLALVAFFVGRHPELELVASCTSGDLAVEIMESENVDLILLDIDMPDLSGMDLIRAGKITPQVIFITAHAEFAAEAFEFDVTDYILKPLTQNRFEKAISKAINAANFQEFTSENEVIFFNIGSNMIKVVKNEIIYVEAKGDHISVCEQGNKHVIVGTVNSIENSVSSNLFMRTHRKFLVKLDAIKKISGFTLELNNGDFAQVSRMKKPELLRRLTAQS